MRDWAQQHMVWQVRAQLLQALGVLWGVPAASDLIQSRSPVIQVLWLPRVLGCLSLCQSCTKSRRHPCRRWLKWHSVQCKAD